jgi:hypothetical protein
MKRLTPVVNKTDLGQLRLWSDDIAEIVTLIQQLTRRDGDQTALDETSIRIEADHYLLDDLETELPKLGKCVEYITVTVDRRISAESAVPDLPGHGQGIELKALKDVMILRLAKVDGCWLEATDPSPDVRGVISDIQTFCETRRRLPQWVLALDRSRSAARSLLSLWVCAVVVAFVISFASVPEGGQANFPWPSTPVIAVPRRRS